MGCDIHMLTEKKQTIKNQEIWVNVDHFSYNPYYDAEDSDDERELELEAIYGDRDYNLFARLAGVRSYNDEIPCISEPRGTPLDVSKITEKEIDYWGSDAHSNSFLTYKELEDFHQKNEYEGTATLLKAMLERMEDVMSLYGKPPSEEQKSKFRVVFFFDN